MTIPPSYQQMLSVSIRILRKLFHVAEKEDIIANWLVATTFPKVVEALNLNGQFRKGGGRG